MLKNQLDLIYSLGGFRVNNIYYLIPIDKGYITLTMGVTKPHKIAHLSKTIFESPTQVETTYIRTYNILDKELLTKIASLAEVKVKEPKLVRLMSDFNLKLLEITQENDYKFELVANEGRFEIIWFSLLRNKRRTATISYKRKGESFIYYSEEHDRIQKVLNELDYSVYNSKHFSANTCKLIGNLREALTELKNAKILEEREWRIENVL